MSNPNPFAPNPTRKTYGRTDQAEAADRVKSFDHVKELKIGRDQTAEVTRWDRYQAGAEAAAGGAFADALKAHPGPAWAGFAREVFSTLYGANERKEVPREERPAGSEWVEKLHDTAETLPEWRALKDRARRDAWACGVAAGEALKVVAQVVEPPKQDPQVIADEIDFIKSLMEGAKTNPQHLRRMASLGRQLQEANKEVAGATASLGMRAASLRSALRSGATKAQEILDEMDTAFAALGGNGSGIASRTLAPSHALKDELMRNAKLRRIAFLAGRMKTAAINKQRNKARPGAEELCDVTAGSDLRRLIPSEIGQLADPNTEALLYRRLTESAALTYELRGKERQAQGPIVVAIDESGSMSGARDEWAKAVLFAFLEIGARQKRPVYLVHFDDGVTRTDEFIDPTTIGLKEIGDAVTYFTGGGTAIGKALAHSADILESNVGPWKRADVVLITDGESGDYAAQSKAIERIKARGGHLYSVAIGCTLGGVLKDESDDVVSLASADINSGDASKVSATFEI